MKNINKQQSIQEIRYKFPYHYIPTLTNGNFNQVISLRWGYIYLSYINFLLKKLRSIKFDTLLDVGCGDGRFLYEASLVFPRVKLTGLDYSERAIKLAEAMNLNNKFICANFLTDKLLFNEKFDVITSIETLEHIPINMIKEFVRKFHFYLKKNGILIITVPSKNIPLIKKHYQHFDLEALTNFLKPFFTIEDVYYLNRNSKFFKKINQILNNKYFVIKQMRLNNIFYRKYEKKCLYANSDTSSRICVLCKKKNI